MTTQDDARAAPATGVPPAAVRQPQITWHTTTRPPAIGETVTIEHDGHLLTVRITSVTPTPSGTQISGDLEEPAVVIDATKADRKLAWLREELGTP